MLKEDNSGFINFPINGRDFNRLETGKTFIYLVAFDVEDITNKGYKLSNVHLNLCGDFISDVSIISGDRYFPNLLIKENDEFKSSIPLTSCICVGWSDYIFEVKNINISWCASFGDLTNEGRKLYYTIKKLHNTKEVRILTFNDIIR